MVDKDNDIVSWSECTYNAKYDKMGVTPIELFYRQNKKCYLTIAYDTCDGIVEFGDLYCTDGEEYAPTKDMLNPTFECAQCLSSFVQRLLEDNNMNRKLDTKIVSILVSLNHSKGLNEGEPILRMSRKTFDGLEEHINNTTLFSPQTNPIKVSASADILLFGSVVLFDETIDDDTIEVEPGSLFVKV